MAVFCPKFDVQRLHTFLMSCLSEYDNVFQAINRIFLLYTGQIVDSLDEEYCRHVMTELSQFSEVVGSFVEILEKMHDSFSSPVTLPDEISQVSFLPHPFREHVSNLISNSKSKSSFGCRTTHSTSAISTSKR